VLVVPGAVADGKLVGEAIDASWPVELTLSGVACTESSAVVEDTVVLEVTGDTPEKGAGV
jgi:hypothetical protein